MVLSHRRPNLIKCNFVLLNIIFLTSFSLQSQIHKTIIYGKVFHALTLEPIPYASISIPQAEKGTVTDTAGNYRIETRIKIDSLRFSSIGFDAIWKSVQIGEENEIHVGLLPSDYSLNEVIILPDEKENPAYPFMRHVLAAKEKNNPESVSAYQCEVYNKIEVDLYDVKEKDKQRLMYKPFQVLFDYVDTAAKKPCIPVFITETISDFFYAKNSCTGKEHIKASRMSGVKSESVSQLLGISYQQLNVYDNNLRLFKKSFVSPLSKACFRYYRFNIMDSLVQNGKKAYKITFKPRRKQELTLKGYMWIQDSTYILKKMDAQMSKDANLNFISDFFISQEFEYVDDHKWMLAKDSLLVLAKILIPHEGRMQEFMARKSTSFQNYLIDQPRDNHFYKGNVQAIMAEDVLDKSEDYWEKARHIALSNREKNIYTLNDSLKNLKFVKILKKVGKGYYHLNKFELGPYFSTYSFNEVEGHRIRLGGRTTKKFSTQTDISAYGAYGFRDERFKYGITLRQFISKQPRQILEIGLSEDIEQLGTTSNIIFQTDNILNSIFRRNPANRLNRVQDLHLSFKREWIQGISHTVEFRRRSIEPLGIINFEQFDGTGSLQNISDITTSELSLSMHFALGEQFLSNDFDRISLGSKFPVLDIFYGKAIEGLAGGDYDYHKLIVNFRQKTRLGRLGKVEYMFQGGKIWGTVPYPLLEIHKGNETFILDEQAFNTMNFFEFASDEYVQGSITWHLDGIIFNKIPLLRKVKFREVLGIKAIAGSINQQNQQEFILPDFLFSLNTPFVEASAGIENIFRILRVDAVWRLTQKDNPGIVTFGLRTKLDFRF